MLKHLIDYSMNFMVYTKISIHLGGVLKKLILELIFGNSLKEL